VTYVKLVSVAGNIYTYTRYIYTHVYTIHLRATYATVFLSDESYEILIAVKARNTAINNFAR